jgi:2-dehydropantoate 2-reductase
MKLLIVGAGAVGGYFGALIAHGGSDVTFLVRPARAEVLRRDGLRIVGARELTISPQLETTGAIGRTYDAVLLAVKAYALDDAIADLAPAVGPQTMIVPLLNGMRHLDALAGRFGDERVLGGVSAVASTLDPDGAVRWLTRGQAYLRYGERGGGMSERIRALDAAIRVGDFDATASERIMADMWQKWVMLAAMGATNCLLRGTIGDVERAGGAATTLRILNETIAVATASGFPPAPEAVANLRAMFTALGSGATTSMYRDLLAGNRVEGEHIVGDLVDRARAHGVDVPLLEAARVSLRIYSESVEASRR